MVQLILGQYTSWLLLIRLFQQTTICCGQRQHVLRTFSSWLSVRGHRAGPPEWPAPPGTCTIGESPSAGPLARAKLRSCVCCLAANTICCGLLKQPDKQKLACVAKYVPFAWIAPF